MANRAHHEWFGVEPGQMPGRGVHDLLRPDLYERSRSHIEAALRGEPQSFERSVMRPDGQGERRSLAQHIPDRQGDQVLGFYAIVHDITEQTAAQRRLTDALRENEGFCRISGYAREELVGGNHRIVNSAFHDNALWVEMWRCIAAGQAWRGEICNRAKDGSLYWMDSIIAPFCGADGKPETDHAHADDLKRSGELLQRHFEGELPYYECETRMRQLA